MHDLIATNDLAANYHVDRHLSPRDNRWIRASGIGDCRRAIAYRLLYQKEGKKEPPINSHGYATFDVGHGIHLRLQQRLRQMGWVDADPIIRNGMFDWDGNIEGTLRDEEYRIAGHFDALTEPLLRTRVNFRGKVFETFRPTEEEKGARYIIDIKSITAREKATINRDDRGFVTYYEARPSAFEQLAEAKEEHIAQASLYAWLTTRPGFKTSRITEPLTQMPGVMILYVAKDLSPDYYSRYPSVYADEDSLLHAPYKIFRYRPNAELVEGLLKKIKEVWSYADQGELPPRDYRHTKSKTAWKCVYCPFRKTCYEKEGFFQDVQEDEHYRVRYLLYKEGKLE